MMLTDYNSGRWQCARTGSRRERESQKVKRGAGEDLRTKSKLKVPHLFFLSPSICKICRSWLLWRIRCPPTFWSSRRTASSYLQVCNGFKFSVLALANSSIPHICHGHHGRCPWRKFGDVEKIVHMTDGQVEVILHMTDCHVEKILHVGKMSPHGNCEEICNVEK